MSRLSAYDKLIQLRVIYVTIRSCLATTIHNVFQKRLIKYDRIYDILRIIELIK